MFSDVKAAVSPGGDQRFKVLNWRSCVKNTLRAFFTIQVGAICVHDCTFHENSGKQWFDFPARRFEHPDGTPGWQKIVTFANSATEVRIRKAILDAVLRYLAANKGVLR